jgi:hypothetical protein
MNIRAAFAPALAMAVVLAGPGAAFAHCDTVDGPVAKAALRALDTGNVNIALPFAPATAEAEIRARFDAARKVRNMGPEARSLADRSFMETVVRLHRQGEGASFDGLKPAGTDFGPAIPAAEAVVDGGSLDNLQALLARDVDAGLKERLAHVRQAQRAPKEAKAPEEVAAVRARVSAELGFITFAEGVRQAAHGAAGEHHAE